MRAIFYVPLIAGALAVNAQKPANPADYAKTITAADAKKRLSILAGAAMEGRNTPSPGLEKAADYIAAQFKSFGLQPGNNGSYRQTYTLAKDSVSHMALRFNGMELTPYTEFSPGFTMPDDVNLHFTDYVFAGYGIADESRNDYGTQDVKGKLVVLLNGSPAGYTPKATGRQSPAALVNKIKYAKEKGAAAIIIVAEKLSSRYSNSVSYRPAAEVAGDSRIPVFIINETALRAVSDHSIAAVVKAIAAGQVQLPMVTAATVDMAYTLQKDRAAASNVIGIVPGTDKKNEYLFITAHYDHLGTDAQGNIYYGADDDGSGTTAVLALAQAFAKAKKEGRGPRRTVVFMTVSGEEKGLWGSEYYSDHAIYPTDKTTADLNIDMIGRVGADYSQNPDSLNYIYVIGDDKLSTDLTPITEQINSRYAHLKLDRKFNDPNDPERIYYRSDHYNFARKGIPVIFYFDGIHADYHKPTDTVDKINFNLWAKRAQLVFYTAWEIANRNDMLKRDLALPQ